MEPAVQRPAVDPPPAPPVAALGGQAFRHSHLCVCHTGSAGIRKFKFKLQIKFIFLWEFLVRVRLVLHRRDRDGTEVRHHPLHEQEGRLCQEDGPANGDLKFEFLFLFLVKFV